MADELSPEEELLLKAAMANYGSPAQEEKNNVHTFLKHVVDSPDTTKLGNLEAQEVGFIKYPLRTMKDCALIAEKIIGNDYVKDYYNKKSEIVSAPSLSKDAKLISLAVVQRREIGDITRRRRPNAGWFRPKQKEEE